MRPEHVALASLAWDADFRRAAQPGFPDSLARLVPGLNTKLFGHTTWQDVEEEATRRLFTFSARLKKLAPSFHAVFRMLGGERALEGTVRLLWQGFGTSAPLDETQLKLDPFRPVAIANAVRRALSTENEWSRELAPFRSLLDYEFAVFRAELVLNGQLDPERRPPFKAGASLLSADLDLHALIRSLARSAAAGVPDEVALRHMHRYPTRWLLAITVDDDSIREIRFPPDAVDIIQEGLASKNGDGWEILTSVGVIDPDPKNSAEAQ